MSCNAVQSRLHARAFGAEKPETGFRLFDLVVCRLTLSQIELILEAVLLDTFSASLVFSGLGSIRRGCFVGIAH